MSDDIEILYQFATATTWPITDPAWTSDRGVRILSASEGSAQVAGEARGSKRFGRLMQPWESAMADVPLPTSHPSLGRYARLLRADPGGAITVDSLPWTAFWWGFCARIRTTYLGKQTGLAHTGRAAYSLVGLAGLLEQVFVIDGWDGNPTASTPWNLFHAPDFNARGKGNRSSSTGTVHTRSVYIFDHTNLGLSSAEWTVAQAINYLLAAFTLAHGGGSPWAFLDDSSRGADVLPPTPVHGKSLLAVLNEIASPRRGLTWTIDIDSANRPRLRLKDWKPATGTALVAMGSEWQVEIEEDTIGAADHALVTSQRPPTTTLTLDFKTSGSPRLAPDGWSFGPPPANDPHDPILRRFKIAAATLAEMRVGLVTDGSGAYDGTRTTAATLGGGPSPRAAELERLTGLPVDQKTTTVTLLGDNEERSKARIFVKGSTASSWEDWSDKVSIELSNYPARITLNAGDTERLDLYHMLSLGGELRITLGVREIAENRLSTRVTDYYRGTREVHRQVGDIEEHTCADGIALAVLTGALVTATGTVMTWDGVGTPLVDELVRVADARVRGRQVKVSLTKKALDWSTLPPGSTISTLDGGPGAVQVDAAVTRRGWDFVARTTDWDFIQAAEAVE